MKSDNFSKKLIVVLALFAAQVFSQNSFTDTRDGKKYKAVKIGEQVWMAENLNYNAEGSKCYANNEVHCKTYGRLYNLETAEIVCPAGWHLPNDDEWKKLLRFAGEGNIAGIKLKAKKGWNSDGIGDFECFPESSCKRNIDGSGTDNYGFAALPGGEENHLSSVFSDAGSEGNWWIAKQKPSGGRANTIYMQWSEKRVMHGNTIIFDLLSVRCIQD